MTISIADLKFFQSERMTDNSDGGGQMTDNEIVTGGTTSSAAPSKTYQINLVGDSGQTLTATTNTDPTAFLDALTAAKKRSLT